MQLLQRRTSQRPCMRLIFISQQTSAINPLRRSNPKVLSRPRNPSSYFFKLLNPSPSFLTTFLGRTSTFLLSKPLNSGLITFGLCSSNSPLLLPSLDTLFPLSTPTPPLFVPPALTASTPLVLAVAPGEVGEVGRNDCVPPSDAF